MITPVQLRILQDRYPYLGLPALKRNAELLLAARVSATKAHRIGLEPAPQPKTPARASKPLESQGNRHSEAPKGKQRVARTRNGGAWSEARFWSHLRSSLRLAFRWWKPAMTALKRAKVGKLYLCAGCGKLFPRKQVQVDHTVAAGALSRPEDIAGFLARLTPEDPDAFKVLCRARCHQAKTNAERRR